MSDEHPIPQLLRSHENRVDGDSADAVQNELIARAEPKVKEFTQWKDSRHITDREREQNRTRSRVRATVETGLLIISRIYDFAKLGYRGRRNNDSRPLVAAVLANMFTVRPFKSQPARCAQ